VKHKYIRLGVNIDHIATLRNARGGKNPSIVRAAKLVENSGADLITVHLREDRRHINEDDLKCILESINIPLNLEISLNKEVIAIAKKCKPHSICFVPENREELTTEGGLDVVSNFNKIKTIIEPLLNDGINISLFVNPNKDQLLATNELGIKTIEFHTGAYANAFQNNNINEIELELKKIEDNVIFAKNLNIVSHAGHGLTFENVSNISSIPNIIELNIGHFLIGESIFLGLSDSISRMRKIINDSIS
jgi:pyridoxine 5-phosphate synthase